MLSANNDYRGVAPAFKGPKTRSTAQRVDRLSCTRGILQLCFGPQQVACQPVGGIARRQVQGQALQHQLALRLPWRQTQAAVPVDRAAGLTRGGVVGLPGAAAVHCNWPPLTVRSCGFWSTRCRAARGRPASLVQCTRPPLRGCTSRRPSARGCQYNRTGTPPAASPDAVSATPSSWTPPCSDTLGLALAGSAVRDFGSAHNSACCSRKGKPAARWLSRGLRSSLAKASVSAAERSASTSGWTGSGR